MLNSLPGVSTLGKIRQSVVDSGYQPPQSVNPGYGGNSPFDMLNRWINQSYQEFIGTLVTRYEDYYINEPAMPFRFFTDGKNWQYPLPDDFDKLLGVDYYTTTNSIQTAVSLKSFMNAERNDFSYPYVPIVPGGLWARYRITGNIIEFQPRPPPGNMQIGVKYVPLQIPMVDVLTITCQGVAVGDFIKIWSGSQVPNSNGVFPVPLTPSGVFPDLSQASGFPGHAAVYTCNAVTSNIPNNNQFTIGATDFETAQNLASQLNLNGVLPYPPTNTSGGNAAQQAYNVSCAAVGNQVIIQIFAPMAVILQTGSPDFTQAHGLAIDPLPVPSFMNPYGAVSNFCSILTGFDEYITADVCEKILRREERDFTPFALHKQEVWTRLKTEAQNRDINLPYRTTNVNRRGGNGGGSGFGY